MLKKEWASIWKDKKLTLSIAVMFFMPLLYTGMLLYAFWDPYNQIEDLPVALINEDTGTVYEGEELQLGNELIQKLTDEKVFKFIEKDATNIEQLLKDQKYYMVIRIPENFSQHATTLLDEKPSKLEIDYIANEGSNFLSVQIGSTAVKEIREEVNRQVAETYATQLYDTIAKLGDGYTDAATSAKDLQSGATAIATSTEELKNYLVELAKGTVTISEGTSSLKDGVVKASTGAASLVEGAATLTQGSSQLAHGAQTAANGALDLKEGFDQYGGGIDSAVSGQQSVQQGQQQLQLGIESLAQNTENLAKGSQSLAEGTNSVVNGTEALAKQLETILPTLPTEQNQQLQLTIQQLQQGTIQIQEGANSLANNSSQLAQGATSLIQNGAQIAAGQQQVTAGLEVLVENKASIANGISSLYEGNIMLAEKLAELSTGTQQLEKGAVELKDGLVKAAQGAGELATGTTELASQSGKLEDGSQALAEGTNKLATGTNEFADGLFTASEEASLSFSDETIDMTVNPVELKKEIINKVDNYGTGLAPYFISLGLFVGALLLTNVYPFVQPAGHPTSLLSWFASKSFVVVLVGIFQVIFMLLVLLVGLELHVDNLGLLIGTLSVISFSFLAIVQVFTVVLGDVGRFLALIVLIIQLSGSAGTFPLELLPAPLQAMHNYLPMTYSVNALRAVISSNDGSILAESLSILAVIGVVCVAISFAFFAVLYKKRYSKKVVANDVNH